MQTTKGQTTDFKPKTKASSAGCLGVFGGIFALAGLLFTFFVTKDFLQTVDARGWDEIPATLQAAEIEVSPNLEDPFALNAKFSYRVEGREFTSDRYALKVNRSGEYEPLALKLRALRARTDLVAFVDPDDPSSAVLEPGSLASGFLILFPLIFVAIGVGCILGAVRMGRNKQLEASKEAISSSPSKKQAGAVVGIVIGVVLALVGIGLLYPLAILPLSRASAAKKWVETPCKITWARVKSHDSDDGTTYSVDIFYSYQFGGQSYRSNRYNFVGGSSSGRAGKQKVVDRYRKAEQPVCYVDPALPERAVLKAELGAGALLALIPGGLILIGVPLTLSSMRHRTRERIGREGGGASSPLAESRRGSIPGTMTYAPGKSRLTSALVLFCVALFWNGLVFGFLFREAWIEQGSLFLKLFSLPFMLVGAVLAVAALHTALALFNPRTILTLAPGELELGGTGRLQWSFRGSTGRLRRFQILLRGVERVTYRRGTSSVTDEKPFYSVLLVDKVQAMEMHRGSVEISLPHDLMYSFELANNAIRWKLEVVGEISFWPDVSDKYDITVRPYPLHSPSTT